jgi:putative CocE/NonD family hydrolase
MYSSGIKSLIKDGYVVLVADARGTGASYGARREGFSPEQSLDGKSLLEWTAAQPWCNGHIGMMGGSYLGQSQFMFATTQEPYLLAIAPAAAPLDVYDHHYVGGVWEDVDWFSQRLRTLDFTSPAQPVDEDLSPDFSMMVEARHEHKGNIYNDQILLPDMFRDSWSDIGQFRPSITLCPLTYAEKIKASGVSIYIMAGWFDIFLRDSLLAYKLFGHKLIIGPWNHEKTCNGGNGILAAENHRWFDYTLKGIDNGITREPAVYYYTFNAPGKEWQFAEDWPLPNQKLTNYYFREGRSGTVASSNDATLITDIPAVSSGRDDHDASTRITVFEGKYSRASRQWNGDMTEGVDKKGLTYTSSPLDTDLTVTGHPVAHLWVSSTAPDGNFFVFLEDVDKEGVSNYVSDRGIRASRRAIHSQSPWNELGIPYHRSNREDYAPLPIGHPVELAFDIYPISYIFRKGHRIRVTVTCSHLPTYRLPESLNFTPPPIISIFRNAEHPSYITLPVILKI